MSSGVACLTWELNAAVASPGTALEKEHLMADFSGQSLSHLAPGEEAVFSSVSKSAADLQTPGLGVKLDGVIIGEGLTLDDVQPKDVSDSSSSVAQTETELEQEDVEVDPDLGRLRLRLRKVPPTERQPVLYFVPTLNFSRSNNLFYNIDPVTDSMFSPGLLFWSTPKIGARTWLSLSLDGNLTRYFKESQYDYNLVRFKAGVRQQLNSRMTGEVGWYNQQLFRTNGDRFLKEDFFYLWLSRRDFLNPKLELYSYYNVALDLADPDNLSRFTHFLTVSLGYYIRPSFQVGVEYQFFLSDYTKVKRLDYFNRFLGRITYSLNRQNQLVFRFGFSTGNSSESYLNYNDFLFSLTYSINFPIY
ncbi:hypothetical protein ACE1B6_06890 [Aerosakkonemataceae cyanobacterium BLCC-F154]|uniref:DUF481 domain-containing protein n=1 Tax=Floridaenema fluviatile BLCC-F154 TaxID=3153640 RepID=A0ABV4Y901_9CYAN